MRTVKVVTLHWTFVMIQVVLTDTFSVTEGKYVSHALLAARAVEPQIFQHVLDVTVDIIVPLLMERTLVSDVSKTVMNAQALQSVSNVLKVTSSQLMDQNAISNVVTTVLLATVKTLINVCLATQVLILIKLLENVLPT